MLPSFEKRAYVKSKYVIRYEFRFFLQNTKKGYSIGNLSEHYLE